ncbi:MAG: hypothetical protein ACRD3C_00690 [Vicinamibacterales bacterium]
MKVRLTRKFSERINGIDLSRAREGDTLDLSTRDALLLMAEGWASPVHDDRESERDRAHDRLRRARPRRARTRQKA